jgi:hypothetical protein
MRPDKTVVEEYDASWVLFVAMPEIQESILIEDKPVSVPRLRHTTMCTRTLV